MRDRADLEVTRKKGRRFYKWIFRAGRQRTSGSFSVLGKRFCLRIFVVGNIVM